MYNVFISYATKDGVALANSVARMLRKDHCLEVFVAEKEIRAGDFIENKVKSAITQCRHILVIFTPSAVRSDWVLGEVDLARKMHKDIIICKRCDVGDYLLPIPLRGRKHITFKKQVDLASKLRQVEWGIPVIIPTGGTAGGLHPVSVGMPKPLFPIGAKPILHHIIGKIEDVKMFSKVIILTPRFSKMIKYYISVLKSKIPIKCLDVSHNLPMALKKLQLNTPFMIHYSDVILEGPIEWKEIIEHHKLKRRTRDVIGTLVLSRHYKLPVGRVVVDSTRGVIKGFVEKPDLTLDYHVNTAVAIFEPKFLTYIKRGDARLYGECIQRAIKAREQFAFFEHGQWKHIQTLTDWYDAQKKHFPADIT